MTSWRRVALLGAASLAALTLAGAMLAPGAAQARGLKTGFIDPAFVSSDGASWLKRADHAGAGIVRFNANWRRIATSKPTAPANPADPAYDFSTIDKGVKDARRRGLKVMLTAFDAPSWAEGAGRPSSAEAGSWKPSPKAFGDFGQALAKRYSGHFHGLPRVRYFEAWNEPNLNVYLAPQWKGKKAEAPDRYRRMLNSFYAGVKKAQSGAKVIGGTTAPFGDPRTKPRNKSQPRMRPLTFLRNMFCLNGKLKPAKCHGAKPHLNVLSHHPINFVNDPHYSAISPNDVEVADMHNVRNLLHAAERHNHVKPGGHRPLWATEIFWITKPPARNGVPVHKAARWLEEGLYLFWKQGVSAAVNYEIRDFPLRGGGGINVTSGIFFNDGKKKPSYKAFRFPFVSHRKSKKKIGVWGKAPRSGKLKIQKKGRKGWHTVKRLHVHRGKVFTPSIRLRGHAKLRAKIGQTSSLTWHQSAPRSKSAAAPLSAKSAGTEPAGAPLSTRAWSLPEVPPGG